MQINKTSQNSIIQSLESITNDLILNKVISINDSLFTVIDLEVYYWHDLHQNNDAARGVKHLRPKGEFKAHKCGIDLSFGNEICTPAI